MTLPAIPLALRPLLAVPVVLFLIPWIFRRPLGEFTGFLHDLRSLLRVVEESKKLDPTERSAPGMAKLFLPTISRDFPAFSWSKERITIEKCLVLVLAVRQALDLGRLVSPSEGLQERVCPAIEDDRINGLIRSFSSIVIRRTAIANYKNLPTLAEIHVVSSVGFLASLAGGPVEKSEDKARAAALTVSHQVEASTIPVLVHTQSVNAKSGYQKVIDISYPHCGAPLQRADACTCPFCKGALIQIDSMVWSLEEIEFQTLI